jgi:hypothetical protein
MSLCTSFSFSFLVPLLKMYMKLVPLIFRVFFYALDFGSDIKVANQQRKLTFSSHNLENLSIADQATSFFNRTFYKYIQLESDIKILSLNYEAIHFIMTTAWLVLGGMFQTSVIVKNIQNQAYIPLIWKVAIIMSSVFMMGPLFISYFSIFTILVSNGSILDKKRSLLLVGSIIKQDQFKLFAFCWMILHNKSSKLLFLNPYLHGKADFAPLLIFTVNDQKRITISYHFL